jgi:hypothetical protein
VLRNKLKYILFAGFIGFVFYFGYFYPKLIELEFDAKRDMIKIDCPYLGSDAFELTKRMNGAQLDYLHDKCTFRSVPPSPAH